MAMKHKIDEYTAQWSDALACKGGGLEAGEFVAYRSDQAPDGREIADFRRRLDEAGLYEDYCETLTDEEGLKWDIFELEVTR